MILYLISIFGFATIIFLILAFSVVSTGSEETQEAQDFLKRRLQVAESKKKEKESMATFRKIRDEEELKKSFSARLLEPLYNRLAKIVELASPKAIRGSAKNWLEAAGWYRMSINQFLAMKGIAAVFVVALVMLVASSLGSGGWKMVIWGLISLFIGFYLPEILVRNQITKRHEMVLKAMPYTLDLLKVSVEAGLGLDEAIMKVVEKSNNPLSDELNRVLYELHLGKQRAEALKDMSKRVGLAELSAFITILVQAEKMGVSIGQILDIQSEQIRIRHHQRLQEKALRTPTLMLVPLILFIFPTIFIIVLGPAMIQLVTSLRSVF